MLIEFVSFLEAWKKNGTSLGDEGLRLGLELIQIPYAMLERLLCQNDEAGTAQPARPSERNG